MAVVADEEYGAAFGQIDLHSDQAIGVAGQMMESNSLTEIHAALVERLPIPGKIRLASKVPGEGTFEA